MEIAVIGAGAAGCFCAIELKRRFPEAGVSVFESGPKPLAKLALTGGGRCNFTNSFELSGSLKEVYPRGDRLMGRGLHTFNPGDCREWFEREGIPSYVQEDGRVFPSSNDAMQVVRTLERILHRLGVSVICNHKVRSIRPGWDVDGQHFDAVVVTSGGGAATFTEGLGIVSEPIVPSLFTLKVPEPELNALTGISVPDTIVSIAGTGFKAGGTLLLTDWGVSGPAILRLSSYAARFLAENQYRCSLSINWTGCNEEETRVLCSETAAANRPRHLSGARPEKFPDRLWRVVLRRAGLREDLRWAELGSKGLNRLCNTLTNDILPVCGRAKFKEEFVSCGGIALSEVNLSSLECKKHPGLYFAGEVLDVDGVTGGFNLQAAWSTAMTVAKNFAYPQSPQCPSPDGRHNG